MSNITYPTVPADAIIDIQVSGNFYKQVVNTLISIGESRPPEEMNSALASMKEDRASKDYYEATIRTLTALVFEIESKAKAQNKLKLITIDEQTGKEINTTES